jgi:tryptophan-rich sensory protein
MTGRSRMPDRPSSAQRPTPKWPPPGVICGPLWAFSYELWAGAKCIPNIFKVEFETHKIIDVPLLFSYYCINEEKRDYWSPCPKPLRPSRPCTISLYLFLTCLCVSVWGLPRRSLVRRRVCG